MWRGFVRQLARPTWRQCLVLLPLLMGAAAPACAQLLARAQGPVVLALTGEITQRNDGEQAVFDMAMLAALPQRSFVTHTPWFKGPHEFSGPLLRDVLAQAGARGSMLRAYALNDYKVELPVEDAMRYDVIVARLLDGQPMTVRQKGPLFVIYPFDQDEKLRVERYYSRSAWQLKRIEVRR